MVPGRQIGKAPIVGSRAEIGSQTQKLVAGFAVVLLCALIVLPLFASRALLQDLFFVFTMLALAQYWNLLAGYAGLVSIGQQASVGLGAYSLFAAAIAGLDPLLAILVAGAVAAILALPTGFALFRLRGAYFAIGSWVAA
jgi:branched-chain amino acid transport system permease protein